MLTDEKPERIRERQREGSRRAVQFKQKDTIRRELRDLAELGVYGEALLPVLI